MSEILRLTGAAIHDVLDDLARLRLQVFREFPYLYDGDLEYERAYLANYAASPDAVMVVALDQGRVVGASTGLPLIEAEAEFQAPFSDPEQWFYFGESVLLSEYRGQGIGHAFFDQREAHAQAWQRLCFCAVDRPLDHPLRPPGYRALDEFWTRRGFVRQPTLKAGFEWQDLDQDQPTRHSLTFWTRHR